MTQLYNMSQVQEAIFSGSPVVNPGYFDVPICDKYSNQPDVRDVMFKTEFDINKSIRKTINNNKDEYIVYQVPTRPSASLTYETDEASSSYYNPTYVNRYYNALEQFSNKEDINNEKHHFFILILLIFIIIFLIYSIK